MIPGLGSDFLPKGSEEASMQKLKMMMVMMDSMADQELDHPKVTDLFTKQPTRVNRIARGAGVTANEVKELLAQYKKFADMVKKMGSIKGLFKEQPGKNINPMQMSKLNQQLTKMIDPRILNQMGGQGGLQSMLQQLQGASGMGMGMGLGGSGSKGRRR